MRFDILSRSVGLLLSITVSQPLTMTGPLVEPFCASWRFVPSSQTINRSPLLLRPAAPVSMRGLPPVAQGSQGVQALAGSCKAAPDGTAATVCVAGLITAGAGLAEFAGSTITEVGDFAAVEELLELIAGGGTGAPAGDVLLLRPQWKIRIGRARDWLPEPLATDVG